MAPGDSPAYIQLEFRGISVTLERDKKYERTVRKELQGCESKAQITYLTN